jgi:hypothetical protein
MTTIGDVREVIASAYPVALDVTQHGVIII